MQNLFTSILSFAQETAASAEVVATEAVAAEGAEQATRSGGFGSLWIFIPIFGIMYFLMIRPQQKKQKQIQEMLRQLKAGDKVMTTAGALGVITAVNDKTVKINFGKDNEVEYVRAAVAEIIKDEAAEIKK
jgi:preprotein translocase subunit YajC